MNEKIAKARARAVAATGKSKEEMEKAIGDFYRIVEPLPKPQLAAECVRLGEESEHARLTGAGLDK